MENTSFIPPAPPDFFLIEPEPGVRMALRLSSITGLVSQSHLVSPLQFQGAPPGTHHMLNVFVGAQNIAIPFAIEQARDEIFMQLSEALGFPVRKTVAGYINGEIKL